MNPTPPDRPPSLSMLLKISRPPLWIALPMVFVMGMAYGGRGLTHPDFKFTPLMVIQMVWLSFPLCLFTFGLNDIHDHASDQINPRKGGIQGVRLDSCYHRSVKTVSFAAGVIFLCISAGTRNPVNLYYAVALLLLAYTYSTPPWRLKARAPLDVLTAGIMGFLAPFALGYSFVDDAAALPFQAWYFTVCVMGFHSFSTIMDYTVDVGMNDRTFATAYGKRAAALFPAGVFLFSLIVISSFHVRFVFMLFAVMSVIVAVFPLERLARYFFLVMFFSAAGALAWWIAGVLIPGGDRCF